MTLFEGIVEMREKSRARSSRAAPLPPPSPYQRAVLELFSSQDTNVFVGATAGAGKTKLLQMIAAMITEQDMLQQGEIATFAAYNVPVKKTLEKVIPKTFTCKTINGIGDQICKENIEGVIFEPKKYEKIMRGIIDDLQIAAPAKRRELLERLEACVQLHVGHNLGLQVALGEWTEIMFDLDAPVLGSEEALHTLTLRTLRQGLAILEQRKEMSFIDQTLAPSHYGWRLAEPYRYLLIDEMQDLTKGHLYLLEAATDERSIIVGVGDRAQSLYGFAGADAQAIEHFKEKFAAKELRLSICYRCPRNHVDLARAYTDEIESAPEAQDGILRDIEYDDFLHLVQPGDMVLCRINAPMVEVCYELIARGIPAIIRGNDLSRSLVAFVRDAATWDGRKVDRSKISDDLSLTDFTDKLGAYATEQMDKINANAEKKGTDPDLRIASLADKLSVITLIHEQGGATTLGDLILDIRKLFRGKPEESVVLSTVHKAKGLEADSVFLLRPDLFPHPKAKSPAALEAEKCAMFVAFTRARKSLQFIRPDADYETLIPKGLER